MKFSELRLAGLAVCAERRAHLKDIVICAIDTFLRESELFGLTGSDTDFDNKLLTVIKHECQNREGKTGAVDQPRLEDI